MNNMLDNYYKFVDNIENDYYRKKAIRDKNYKQLKKVELYLTIVNSISILIGIALLYIIFSVFANTFNIFLWPDLFKILYAIITIIGLIALTITITSMIENYV